MQCQMMVSDQEHQVYETSPAVSTSSSSSKTTSAWFASLSSVIAGSFAGAGSRMVVAPLDLIRIRLQLEPDRSFWSHIQKITCESGWQGFFRGNVPATYLWVGYSAVQFTVYAQLSEALLPYLSNHKPIIAFVSGATAGIAATVMTYPLDICRTNFAATSATENGPSTMLSFARGMIQRQGFRGFWAGVVPSLCGIVPYMGFNFLIYETLLGEKTAVNAGMAGAISGASSKLLVYPFDTVKKRLQVQAYASNQQQYKGMLDCFIQIVRHQGFGSLYRGILPSMMKNTIATSLSFSLYILAQNALIVLTGTL